VIPVLYHSYHLCFWQYCISITKMSDTCTPSQLSPMSLTVLYQYHQDEWYLYSITGITYVSTLSWSKYYSLVSIGVNRSVITVIEYRYHSSWWYWYSTVRDIGDNCDRVQVSLILVILVSPRWVIPVLYHSYHLCLWLLSVSPRWVIPVLYHSYHLYRVQVSLILVILIQYSQRHKW
jgi:hypothetical protein